MEFINLIWSQLKAPYYPPCDRGRLAGEWVKLWQGCYNFSDSSISYLQTPGLYCPCLRNLQIEITLEDSTFKPVSYCPPRMSAPKMSRIYLANLFKWGPIGYSGHTMTRLMLSSSGPTHHCEIIRFLLIRAWHWWTQNMFTLTWCCGGRSPRWPHSRWRYWPCSRPPRPLRLSHCPWSAPDYHDMSDVGK